LNLAKVYLADGQRDCAEWELAKVLSLEPNHAAAAELRASLTGD
jgi:Tfp pilus assembly protein PilF